jgi:AcrR family transcriptional regulator
MAPIRDSQRHEDILDAAIRLIRTKGMEGTSLQDIADAVGLKKGSLSTYFGSKAELADLIKARFRQIAQILMKDIAAREDLSAEDKLREMLYTHAEHCAVRISSPVLVSFIQLWDPVTSPSGRRQIEIREEYEAVFRTTFVSCVAEGSFRPTDETVAVKGMVGMMSWTAFWYDKSVNGPLRDVVDRMIDMCFDGLRPGVATVPRATAVPAAARAKRRSSR